MDTLFFVRRILITGSLIPALVLLSFAVEPPTCPSARHFRYQSNTSLNLISTIRLLLFFEVCGGAVGVYNAIFSNTILFLCTVPGCSWSRRLQHLNHKVARKDRNNNQITVPQKFVRGSEKHFIYVLAREAFWARTCSGAATAQTHASDRSNNTGGLLTCLCTDPCCHTCRVLQLMYVGDHNFLCSRTPQAHQIKWMWMCRSEDVLMCRCGCIGVHEQT